MIKSFRLHDVFSLADLQKSGQKLDLTEQLIHAYSPLRSALLTAVLPSDSVTSTYILDSTDENEYHRGLIQTRRRPDRPEQDVVFLGPPLDYGKGSHAIWQRLLSHVCVKAGEAGHYRIYARLKTDDEAIQIFKNIGFSEYAEEAIFEIEAHKIKRYKSSSSYKLKLRKQTEADSWGLQRLYASVTPRAVQIAEGLAQGQWQLNGRPFYDRNRRHGYVWERDGEIAAALHIRRGERGSTLQVLLHPNEQVHIESLIRAALNITQRLWSQGSQKIYPTIRTYQSGLGIVLTDLGFTPIATQVVMVKHTTVRAKDVLSRLVDFEAKVEAKPVVPTPFMKRTTTLPQTPVGQKKSRVLSPKKGMTTKTSSKPKVMNEGLY